MAGSDNAMQLVFQASIGDVLAKVEALKGSLVGLGKAASEGVGGDLPAATRRATEATNGITDSLSRLTSEQRTQQRMIGFWVRDINEVIGVSRGAQSAVSGLAAGMLELAGGLSAGAVAFAAFEIGKGVIAFFREAAEESKRAADSIKSAVKEISDSIQALGRTQVDLKKFEVAELRAGIVGFKATVDSLREQAGSGAISGAEYSSGWDAANEALGRFYDKYKLVGEARTVGSLDLILSGMDDLIAKTDQISWDEKVTKQIEKSIQGIKILADSEAFLPLQYEKLKPRELGTDLKSFNMTQPLPETAFWENRGSNYQLPGSGNSQRYWENMTKDMWGPKPEDLANLRKAQDEFKQFKSLAEGVAGSIGSAFGDAFTSLLTGTKRVDEAIKELFQSILRSFVDMIAKMIAEALAASILRIILGIGTGGASAGAGVAGYASMFSFDSGSWSVPRTGLALIHQGEMVIPAGQAEAIRQGGLGGGGSPVNVTMNVQALDGASVYRVLRENETHLVRVLSEASRNGRI